MVIRSWLALHERRVIGELIEVLSPNQACEELMDRFDAEFATPFIQQRKEASTALLSVLDRTKLSASDSDNPKKRAEKQAKLDDEVCKLRSALEKQRDNGPPSVPGVAVIFPEQFSQALGSLFGDILSRTIEKEGKGEEEEEEEESE